MRIRWTALAVADLKLISFRAEGRRNQTRAKRACRAIYNNVQLLRRFPESGKPGVEDGTRELVPPGLPYTVTYRVLDSGAVQILRTWHGPQPGIRGFSRVRSGIGKRGHSRL